jgi:hypothetical protein
MQIKTSVSQADCRAATIACASHRVPQSLRQEAKQYNRSYAERLVHGRHGAQISNALDGLLQELLLLLQTATTKSNGPLLVMAHNALKRIKQAQCNRWMARKITFLAIMHYVTLSLLAMAICISFLAATDQSQMIFESLQGRILWTILIGSFTSFSIAGRIMERLPLEQQVGFASRSCFFYDKHHSTLPNTAKLESLFIAYGSTGFLLFFISGGTTYRATTAHSFFFSHLLGGYPAVGLP